MRNRRLERTLVAGALAGALFVVSACAPRLAPAPEVVSPRFPGFLPPTVPPNLQGTPAALRQDRAWRFLQVGDLQSADLEVGFALRATPGFYPALTTAGYIELARKESERALGHFDRAIDLREDYVPALAARGEALDRLDRRTEAIAAFEAALAVDASLSDLRRRIDVMRFRQTQSDLASARLAARSGRPDEAMRLYEAAIATSPESAFLYRELGVVERQLDNADSALGHFRTAIALDPTDAASHVEIAELLERRDDVDAALLAYDAALAIEPNASVESRREALRARAELAGLPEEFRAIETLQEISRAHLAALIGVRLGTVLQEGRPGGAVVLTDVRSSWAEPWIMSVAGAGVMEPYDNHTFQPGALVRRIDIAQAVSRVLPQVVPEAQLRAWQGARVTFSDLMPSHLAYPAASVAVAAGVLAATPDGSFRPSRVVEGAEAVAAIDRLQTLARDALRR